MTRRRPGVRSIAVAVCFAAGLPWVTYAAGNEQLDSLREFLREYSIVTDGGDTGPREVISTRLEAHPEPGHALLIYSRASYTGSDANSLQNQQIIHYTVRFADMARESIRVQSWDGPHSGNTFWLVSATVAESAGFVQYTNVFETRLDDGSVDVTTSRGRVRELVLGYFADEAGALKLADGFAKLLEPDA